jgi:hypothetical protein
MRWLLVKDLQILRRSPLLVAMLILYPIVIAALVGFALTSGPSKPRVAFLNEIPAGANTVALGGENVDVAKEAKPLFDSIDPVRVKSRAEAIQKVRDGDVLAALIIPPDVTAKLQAAAGGSFEPASVEVFYNADDPAKQAFVENTIKARLQEANTALSGKLTQVAVNYLGLITWPIIRDNVERVVTVSEDDIRSAMRLVWERMKLLIEPSAAVGVAVVLSDEFKALDGIREVGVVLCGGNVSLERLPW